MTATESKAYRYEIEFEGGSRFVIATSGEEALRIFAERWAEHGDTPPAARVSACWSIEG